MDAADVSYDTQKHRPPYSLTQATQCHIHVHFVIPTALELERSQFPPNPNSPTLSIHILQDCKAKSLSMFRRHR